MAIYLVRIRPSGAPTPRRPYDTQEGALIIDLALLKDTVLVELLHIYPHTVKDISPVDLRYIQLNPRPRLTVALEVLAFSFLEQWSKWVVSKAPAEHGRWRQLPLVDGFPGVVIGVHPKINQCTHLIHSTYPRWQADPTASINGFSLQKMGHFHNKNSQHFPHDNLHTCVDGNKTAIAGLTS